MTIYLVFDGGRQTCETEFVPKEGQEIHIKYHKGEGKYVVNEVDYKYTAVQNDDLGPLKLEAEIYVYLNKK
jgi:hypothetical protein